MHTNQLRRNHDKTQSPPEPPSLTWDSVLDTFCSEDEAERLRGSQHKMQEADDTQCRPTRKRRQPPWVQFGPKSGTQQVA
ncbi:unnamed protein product, partial [Dicrocoelium dendriticum]